MTAGEPRYLSQGVDYLGFLEAKLRDLRGIATLACELIQNADDVKDEQGQPGASRITFDLHEDALVVENDGIFRDLDFKRMQTVAGGGKREEEGTTGAFGIGFVAVYQITDHPEIFSSGRHWTIRPEVAEGERIVERDVPTEGTRFRLPWALDPESEVRRKLRVEAIRLEELPTFEKEIGQAISLASLFLKQLKVLELRRSGELIKRVERETVEDDQILIQDGDQTLIWRIFRGSFEDEAARLRLRHGSYIEAKRRSDVQVAIPDELLETGRLFAVLPSDTITPLPFHINADFFPTTDRKRIIFESDYQSEWNRAAVQAAAYALATGFDKLPRLLGHKGLWLFLQRLNECQEQVKQGKYDRSFSAFWEEIAPNLQESEIIFTTRKQWVVPGKARLLESEAERDASTILEALGIPIVHSELRPYFGLLRRREIGTSLLSVQDVINAFKDNGLDKPQTLAQAPSCLKELEQWRTLWHALDALLARRQSPWELDEAKEGFGSCAIALSADETLWPPEDLFRGDTETKKLFPEVHWLAEYSEPDQVPARLVVEFTPEQAVEFLSKQPAERIQTAWERRELKIENLYRWFETRKSDVLSDTQLKERLHALPIWPASGQLRPLSDLYIPGGFEDPLKLSALVDLEFLEGRKEFLKDLGVQELTFETYVREQVPRVLEERPDLSASARRQLVQLLAQRLGEIRDYPELQHLLSNLPLIECTDGHFRAAGQVYIQTNVVRILGDCVYVAAPTKKNSDAVKALYAWLGVAQEPRPDDVIQHVEELVVNPPNHAARQVVETVFEYLVSQWPKWSEDEQQPYRRLRQIAWLPGNRDQTCWYRPDELYVIFRSYLFETQATFLDLPRQLQTRTGATDLIKFLGIEIEPTPAQVVRHLKLCSEQGIPVNKEIYRFLNDNIEDSALDRLDSTACLLLPDDQYVRPDQVFWDEHPFGAFRYRLGPELRQYNALFDRLGVREQPEDQDFMRVLVEISEQFGESHAPLDDQTYAILMSCWEALSTALEEERLSPEDLSELQDRRVIPDPRRLLSKPENLFFEDRAGLAAKFPQFLENSVIARPQGAWRGMQAVGVRPLSQAAKLHLIECEDPTDDPVLADLVKERRVLIDRVVESERASSADEVNATALDHIHFQKATNLAIQYFLQAFQQERMTEPESVPALLILEEENLMTVHENGRIPWTALARELAYAIKPLGEIGGLASGIKEAIANSSFEEANCALDDLGYPPLQQRPIIEVRGTGPVSDLGGDELTPDEVIDAILGGTGKERSDIPVQPDETPVGAGRVGRAGLGGNRPAAGGAEGRKKGKSRGKLRTYVVFTEDEEDETDPEIVTRRSQVDQAGVDHVIEYERSRGRTPTEMPHHHKGYDLESYDARGQVRYIEVKSLSGDWSTRNAAGTTKTQFEMAQEKGEQFWLYVVERAISDDYQISCIQNPANLVNQFLFDDGWQVLAELEEAVESFEDLSNQGEAVE